MSLFRQAFFSLVLLSLVSCIEICPLLPCLDHLSFTFDAEDPLLERIRIIHFEFDEHRVRCEQIPAGAAGATSEAVLRCDSPEVQSLAEEISIPSAPERVNLAVILDEDEQLEGLVVPTYQRPSYPNNQCEHLTRCRQATVDLAGWLRQRVENP